MNEKTPQLNKNINVKNFENRTQIMRTFDNMYYEEFSWLCSLSNKNKLYCWICLISAPYKFKNNFIKGHIDIKNIGRASERDENSDIHKKSVLMLFDLRKKQKNHQNCLVIISDQIEHMKRGKKSSKFSHLQQYFSFGGASLFEEIQKKMELTKEIFQIYII